MAESTGGGNVTATPAAVQVQVGGELQNLATKGQESSADTSGETTERPAWFPEGVNTHEEFRAWYDKEHPGVFDKSATETSEAAKADATKAADLKGETAPTRTVEEITASLTKAGGFYADPRYLPAAIEFEQNGGKVSDETIKTAAAAFGVPEDMARTFIESQSQLRTMAGQNADAEGAAFVGTLQGVVGGADEYGKFTKWANEGGLSKAQQDAYNAAIDAGNAPTAKVLLEGYNKAYQAAGHGPGPRDITVDGGHLDVQGAALQGYASSHEMQEAMNDRRYGSDPAYTHEVERKTGASKF